MLEGRENGVLSSFTYRREDVHTSLLAQQLEISFDLAICNQRTLVLRLPIQLALVCQEQVFSGPPVLWGTSGPDALGHINHAQSQESCLFLPSLPGLSWLTLRE